MTDLTGMLIATSTIFAAPLINVYTEKEFEKFFRMLNIFVEICIVAIAVNNVARLMHNFELNDVPFSRSEAYDFYLFNGYISFHLMRYYHLITFYKGKAQG